MPQILPGSEIIQINILSIGYSVLLWVGLCSPQRYVKILTLDTCDCDLTWKWGHCRCDQAKMRSYWIRVDPNPVRRLSKQRRDTDTGTQWYPGFVSISYGKTHKHGNDHHKERHLYTQFHRSRRHRMPYMWKHLDCYEIEGAREKCG